MPLYKVRGFTNEETDVWGAISALNACYSEATPEAIAEFTGLSKTRVSHTLKSLKNCGLVVTEKAGPRNA